MSVNPHEIKYRNLIADTIQGEKVPSRAGGTTAVFGKMIEFNMEDGFPLFTGRKIFDRGVLGELKAFLNGATHVDMFKEWGCNYWDGFADEHGELGPVYGYQWRCWPAGAFAVDQLKHVISTIKRDPTCRRLMVNAWNVAYLDRMALPPCHYNMQFNVNQREGTLDVLVSMRSLDLMLGFPSDVLLYAILLKLVANETDLFPGRVIFSLGSCHIYDAHMDQALEYLRRPITDAPQLVMRGRPGIDSFVPGDVSFTGYQPGPAMQLELLL